MTTTFVDFPVSASSTRPVGQSSVDEDGGIVHPVDLDEGEMIKVASAVLFRRVGSEMMKRRLKELVDANVIGSVGAEKIFLDAFGIRLGGLPTKRSGHMPVRFRRHRP